MSQVHGSCDQAFAPLREILQQKIADGDELGASLCINIDGKNVLDLWGGYADASQTLPWEKEMVTGVWSTTKVITALAAHILINRGVLDPNEKVAKYWPDFGTNGKENVTVANVLTHSSGMPAFDQTISFEDYQDVERMTEHIAEQAPWYTPGSHTAYQWTNHGHMVGEIVRRVSGKSLTQFIAEELAEPLGVDFWLGVPEKDWIRTADMVPQFSLDERDASIKSIDPDSNGILTRAIRGSFLDPFSVNTPAFRKSENGAIGGYSNARGLARIGSIVSLDGTVDTKKYLSPRTIDKMLTEQISGVDLCTSVKARWCLGFALPSSQGIYPLIPDEPGIGFWGGWGGSMLIMDRGRRMTIGYVMNKMESGLMSNSNFDVYLPEIYKGFDIYTKGSS
ncbi:beta-lactamase [Penicillium angulare]|uniref:Beta-lactamase n=1 Tax=Penicillium angulare TaxID=116970 RepID=A0A9W9KBR8_9EURO|nr:beta-lactamase [Penicillium angulare]